MSINRRVLIRFALYALVAVMPLIAQDRPTVTLENRSGDDALVRLVGPSSGTVSVADSATRTVEVHGGTYRMYVRYGLAGKYRYTKGDSFVVYEGPDAVDQISITLHKVVGGNYGTAPSNEAEFNGAK
jgi:hypothetical protein